MLGTSKKSKYTLPVKWVSDLGFWRYTFAHIFKMNNIFFHAKFHAYTLICFQDTDNNKWLRRPVKFSGLITRTVCAVQVLGFNYMQNLHLLVV